MKVAIIGLGFRLGYLGQVFTEIDPDFEIVAHVDPEPAGMKQLEAENISAGRAYETPEEMIAKETFDLLMIGSPNTFHLEHIRIGLEAGLTVFTEKPIVTTIEESFELARLLNQYGQDRLMVGLVFVTHRFTAICGRHRLRDFSAISPRSKPPSILPPIMARSSCATGAVTTSMPAASCWKSAATTSTFITA